MPEVTPPKDEPVSLNRNLINPDIELRDGEIGMSSEELRWARVGLILAAGILLVLFSNYLAVSFIAEGNSWNPERANQMATNIRIVGGLLFIFGLVERVLIHFSKFEE